MSKRIALFPVLLLALLVVAAAALTWMNFSQALPRSQWAQAAWSPDIDVIEQMIFHYSLLPRLAISLLVGAGLGLVGCWLNRLWRRVGETAFAGNADPRGAGSEPLLRRNQSVTGYLPS